MNLNQIMKAIQAHPGLNEPGFHFIGVFHDIGCPQTDQAGQSSICTCKSVDIKPISENEWRNSQLTTRKARRKAQREADKAIRKAKRDA